MFISPYAFNASGLPLGGAAEWMWRFLANNYAREGKVFPGDKEQLFDVARGCNEYDLDELKEGFKQISTGKASLITVDKDGVILPTEYFGLPPKVLKEAGIT